jgi:RNA polymerase sigma factor (sigma-70 family)
VTRETPSFYAANALPIRPATFRHDSRLVEFLPDVRRQAKRWRQACAGLMDYDDLVAIGTVALWCAIESYSSERGAFPNFARSCVRHAMETCKESCRVQRRRVPAGSQSLDDESGTEHFRVRSTTPQPDDLVAHHRTATELRNAAASLEPSERLVLDRRFHDEATCDEVGAELGVSRQRAHQIERAALRKVKKRLRLTASETMP